MSCGSISTEFLPLKISNILLIPPENIRVESAFAWKIYLNSEESLKMTSDENYENGDSDYGHKVKKKKSKKEKRSKKEKVRIS